MRLSRFLLCGALWIAAAAHAQLFSRTLAWQEEVLLGDGSTVWIDRTQTHSWPASASLPGSGAILKSTLKATLPLVGKIAFEWKGRETPVALDVVAGVAWIVLPISGLDMCEKYGFPEQSAIALSWERGTWGVQPWDRAPRELKRNLVDEGWRLVEERIPMKHKRDRKFGVELEKGLFVENAKYETSCRKIVPFDPAYDKAMSELQGRPKVAVAARVVQSRDDAVTLQVEAEDWPALGGMNDRRRIVGCRGKVSHVDAHVMTTRIEGGQQRNNRAHRAVLITDGAPPRHIYLRHDSELERISCLNDVIYVLLGEESRDVLTIHAYDLQGNWSRTWVVKLPMRQWLQIADFKDLGDRFALVIGDFHYGPQGQTLRKRANLEVLKQP